MSGNAFVFLMLMFDLATAADEGAKNKTIEELEKQKSELYKKINFAIDESVKSLLKANDTEAALGLEYMRDLKKHIKELNETDNSKEERGIDVDSKSELENRRSFKGLQHFKETKRPRNDPFDFEAVLKPKRISEKDWKEMLLDRQKMQKKLDLWILEREKERERKKKYKMEKKKLLTSGKYEKCPRFGYYGKKKREKGKSRDIRPCRLNITSGKEYDKCPIPDVIEMTSSESVESRKRKVKMSEKNKYPCCRKCCKKSYMGCL